MTSLSVAPTPTQRIDLWLWAVRIFKQRGLATEACKAGQVTLGDVPLKPSRDVRGGEEILVRQGVIERRLKVIGLPRSRVGAKLVAQYCEDLTPASEWEKLKQTPVQKLLARPKGAGRPTKRERRELDQFLGEDE